MRWDCSVEPATRFHPTVMRWDCSMEPATRFHPTMMANALGRHVPELVLILLYGTFIMTGGVVGYAAGVAGHRTSFVTCILIMLIVILPFIIVDLDRPRRGLIRVSQSYRPGRGHRLGAISRRPGTGSRRHASPGGHETPLTPGKPGTARNNRDIIDTVCQPGHDLALTFISYGGEADGSVNDGGYTRSRISFTQGACRNRSAFRPTCYRIVVG